MTILAKKIINIILAGALVISIGQVSGCASVPASPKNVYNELAIPNYLAVPTDYKIGNQKDPFELIKQGVNMSEKCRADYAADFFQMASSVPAPANDNTLKLSALFAQASEHLRDGNQKAFISIMNEIDGCLNRTQQANLSEQEAVLVALYDIACGKKYSSGKHPQIVRVLFIDTVAE